MGGIDPDRIYVDKGYRGHDYTGSASVMIAGSRRGLTPTMRRELKRRSAIEPTIGHMKTDGRLDRNFLPGTMATPSMRCSWPQVTICASSWPNWPFGVPSSGPRLPFSWRNRILLQIVQPQEDQ